ncbi:MAG: phage holin family protein [Planctomycetota bacterium]|jgi:hypothetical protein
MQNTMRKVRALVRAQKALTRLELHGKKAQGTYLAVALVFALLTLGLLDLAAFLGLREAVGAAWAAFIVAAVNAAIAGLLVHRARRVGAPPELKAAQEVRDLAFDEIAADVEDLKEDVARAREDLRKIRSALGTITRAVASTAAKGIAPVVDRVKRTLRRSEDAPPAADEPEASDPPTDD